MVSLTGSAIIALIGAKLYVYGQKRRGREGEDTSQSMLTT